MDSNDISVAVAYHSGAGHTARMADAVAAGARSLAGASAACLRVDLLDAAGWRALDDADAIVFGAPTHMGAPSAPFAAFAAATQGRWLEDRWRDKVAAGFTNSGTIAGDKLHTLQTFAILAAQHGMVWAGLDLKAGWATSTGSPDDLNRLGSWLGADEPLAARPRPRRRPAPIRPSRPPNISAAASRCWRGTLRRGRADDADRGAVRRKPRRE